MFACMQVDVQLAARLRAHEDPGILRRLLAQSSDERRYLHQVEVVQIDVSVEQLGERTIMLTFDDLLEKMRVLVRADGQRQTSFLLQKLEIVELAHNQFRE